MKQTMEWLFRKQDSESITYRCSVCNSEISVKHGEELPYCKHCESEPDGEQIANKMSDNEIIQSLSDLVKSTERIKHCGTKKVIVGAELLKDILNFINSRQAKIEALQMDNSQMQSDIIMANQNYEHMKGLFEQSQNVKRRAIKRFLDTYKDLQKAESEIDKFSKPLCISDVDISMERLRELLKGRVLSVCNENVRESTIREFIERFLKKVHKHHYVLSDKNNSTDYGMFTIGIEQAINEVKKEMVGDNI